MSIYLSKTYMVVISFETFILYITLTFFKQVWGKYYKSIDVKLKLSIWEIFHYVQFPEKCYRCFPWSLNIHPPEISPLGKYYSQSWFLLKYIVSKWGIIIALILLIYSIDQCFTPCENIHMFYLMYYLMLYFLWKSHRVNFPLSYTQLINWS